MKSDDALRALAEVTAYQWGMVTSAQAAMLGVTRLDLSRLAADGQLDRVSHGVYRHAGAPAGVHADLQAAWLSTEPKTMGAARIRDAASGVVVAAESAAHLHGIGDFRPLRHEFVSPSRRQSQRSTIRYRQRTLDPHDVTLVDGLPVMTMERTLADLVEEVGDLSLVADALRDASRTRDLDPKRLSALLAPLAQRNGLPRGDGAALLDRLMQIGGTDLETVARLVAANASLGSRVTANYVNAFSKVDLDRLVLTPEMQQTMRSVKESVVAAIQSSMTPQLIGIFSTMGRDSADLVENSGLDEIAHRVSRQLASSDVMETIGQEWASALSHSIALEPETLAAIREARNVIARG